ncbi:MAG TPA: asparagine synthase (glutamine-hydrolyzing) [Candidatus Acidoferrales bacterium]|nr:asparagine synthase (glutamine-hydrolyzing) [Candidatus Acidoferrales bacterium]
MCGICGTIGIGNSAKASSAIRRMNFAMHHRGPDAEGELIAPSAAPLVSLGMRRLSIIDLASGQQPVFNETNDVAVVYNGEMYNFPELREKLEGAGHTFRTHSDTEVIVHSYEEWGQDCLQKFRGMFAIALLDMRKASADGAKLLLARDRLGIKPLYYSLQQGTLLFASEVRALLATGLIHRQLSPEALDSYLLFGSVCEPMTLVEGIYSIPPGHYLQIPAGGPVKNAVPQSYWNFGDAALPEASAIEISFESAARGLRPLLEEAVRGHLLSDVPLGIFLSSGIDSTAIVALAARAQAGLQTFTVVFEEQDFSEAAIARATARQFDTQHQELLLRGGEMLDHLDDAVGSLDQPTMDGMNTYFVSWAVHRAGLKVALSGLGGDEIFGGYATFASVPRAARLARASRYVPRAVRSRTADLIGRAGGPEGDARRKVAALWNDSRDLPHPYFFARALFTPEQVARLRGGDCDLQEPTPWRKWLIDSARQAARLDSFSAVSCLEARSYMAQTLLRDTDSVSMAHSLEVRVPLLDHLLVEHVSRLQARVKQRSGVNKALLVEALRDVLPEEVIGQRKKTFTFPWQHWLRGPLAPKVGASLADVAPALAAHLDAETVRAVWSAFESNQMNWSRPWSLYVLSEWCNRHLDTNVAEQPPMDAFPLRRV